MQTGVCTNTKKLQGRFPTSGYKCAENATIYHEFQWLYRQNYVNILYVIKTVTRIRPLAAQRSVATRTSKNYYHLKNL